MVLPCLFLTHDMINPTPHEPFCHFGVYPKECMTNNDIECTRGEREVNKWLKEFYWRYSMSFIGILMVVLLLSMAMIVYTVCAEKVENEAESEEHDCHECGQDSVFQLQSLKSAAAQRLRYLKKCDSKIITCQAFLYLIACIIVWGSSILSWFPFFQTTYLFFMPLQGFLNLLIFMYHKVYVLTRVTCDCLDWKEALWLIIVSPKDAFTERQVVGNIELIMVPVQNISQLDLAVMNDAESSSFSSNPASQNENEKIRASSVKSEELSVQNQSSRGDATDISGFSFMDGGMKVGVQQGSRPKQKSRRSENDSKQLEIEPKDSDPCEESFMDDDISYGHSKASHFLSVGLSYGQHSDTSTVKR